LRQPLQRMNGTGVPAGSSPERPPGFRSSRVAFRFQKIGRTYGTNAADTPRAKSAADDAPSWCWCLHARLRGRSGGRGRRDGLLAVAGFFHRCRGLVTELNGGRVRSVASEERGSRSTRVAASVVRQSVPQRLRVPAPLHSELEQQVATFGIVRTCGTAKTILRVLFVDLGQSCHHTNSVGNARSQRVRHTLTIYLDGHELERCPVRSSRWRHVWVKAM
jgi:hypothetical protein